MAQLYTDQARTTLATGILAAGTSLTVSSNGELFPVATVNTGALDSGDWFKLVLDDGEHFEVVVVRTHASGGDTFSNLLRGQEGTMARDWDAGAVVGLRVTAADMDQAINNRVEKVAGKGLSQEDYTTAEKNKLDGIAESAAALGTATPSALGTANAGVSAAGAHEDHVHPMPTAAQVGAAPAAHVGAGGTAHANATTSADGFMSSADKTKLNGIAASAAALGDTVALDLGTASAGSGSTAARIDHRHKLPTVADIGAAASGHTHTPASIGAAAAAHGHAISDVTGLQTNLDALKSIPGSTKSTAYTLVMADAGQSIDTTTDVTIPSNSAVAFPVGTTVMVTNTSASNSTISITTDTLRQAGTTNTGSRTLAGYGVATLRKVAATTWYISGAGLS